MQKVNVRRVGFSVCLILLFFIESAHAQRSYLTKQVFIEFIYFDPSQSEFACPTCPGWREAWEEFVAASKLIADIQKEYGDQVIVERVDRTTTEGFERCSEYDCKEAQTVVINRTIKLEGDKLTKENLKEVIDDYLTSIYIRADGSIDPPWAPISTADNVTYTFTDNIHYSIVVSRDNIVVDGLGNTLQGATSGTGIELSRTSNVTVRNIRIRAWFCGIFGNGSARAHISANSITDNSCGIFLNRSSNNRICGNTIANNNEEGILLWNASNNSIFRNNFVNNTNQACVTPGYTNIWDGGYISGGNYWSNYTGVDLDHDGIGDTSLVIDAYNKDNYPLMSVIVFSWETLLDRYDELLTHYQSLNSTYRTLISNYTELQDSYESLQTSYSNLQANYNSLNSTYNSLSSDLNGLQTSFNQLNSTYTALQDFYDELQSEQQSIISELNNIRNIRDVFIATTIILIVTTVYFATGKPKMRS